MLSVPDEVKCAVCKNIFCCSECRVRHEANAHSQNDVWNERNRMLCAFCKGLPAMEFQNRNDFALIMHLCQSHLPLHCKKCLTQFNSIGDFTVENKCVHVNDGCNLQTLHGKNESCQKSTQSDKEPTNVHFVTANCLVHRPSFERSSIADNSVLSLKNYSTILHNSNNTLYKTQSPNSVTKALKRQTSTPMHENLVVFKSPETNGCSCSISSGSSQLSSINSSSESDTSPQAITETSETRHDLHQQSVVVTQKKTTTIKRSKQSLAMTPLTRQVMTKSIHRAILEYQHAQCGPVMSPRSPLDLRTSFVIRRESVSPDQPSKAIEMGTIGSKLETVLEQIKDDENKENNDGANSNGMDDGKFNDTIGIGSRESVPIKETPIPVTRKSSTEKIVSSSDGEIWFTPKEISQPSVKDEIYTPKVTKKRQTQLNESIEMQKETTNDDDNDDDDDDDEFLSPEEQPKKETQKATSSKLWSFVSTILRFASLTPSPDRSDTIDSKSSQENSLDSPAIIKRCASMADVLCEKTTDEEMEPNNRSQPIKRRRIQSMHASLEEQSVTTTTTYRRIQCRRPIRSMQSTF